MSAEDEAQLHEGSRPMEVRTVPKVFISYSWDDEEHKEWVRALGTRLRRDGIDVTLDQWHLHLGDQIPHFMERSVRENDFVLIICTPKYKQKSEDRRGGVGYEGDIIQGEVFVSGNQRKFIPILRRGSWQESAPIQLLGKFYLHLGDPEISEARYLQLLKSLSGVVEGPPILRSKPSSDTRHATWSEVRALHGHNTMVKYIAISDDGKRVASASDGLSTESVLRLWHINETTYRDFWPPNRQSKSIDGLAMSADGLAIAFSSYWVYLIQINNDTLTHREFSFASRNITITADGNTVVRYAANITLWKPSNNYQPKVIKYKVESAGLFAKSVHATAMDREGNILLLALGSQVIVYSLSGETEISVLRGDGHKVQSLAISGDGSTALIFSAKSIRLWDIRTGRNTHTIEQQSRAIKCAVLNMDGSVVAVGLSGGDVEIHYLAINHRESFFCGTSDVVEIAMTPDSSTVLVSLQDCSLRVWKRSK